MTEKDKKLIEQANKLTDIFWSTAYRLAEEADTEEAKKELENIGKQLYAKEEAFADCR